MADFDITSNRKSRKSYNEYDNSRMYRDEGRKSFHEKNRSISPKRRNVDEKMYMHNQDDSWKSKPMDQNYMNVGRPRLSYEMDQSQMYNNQQNQYNQQSYQMMHQHNYQMYTNTSMQPNQDYGQQYDSNDMYNRQNQYYQMVSEPRPPGEDFMEAPPPPTGVWPQPPPPPAFHGNDQSNKTEEKQDLMKKEAAVAQEKKQQRATLIKQREEYTNKSMLLQRELDMLQEQKQEIHDLCGSGSVPRDSQRIIKENAKLQAEIQNKLSTINNVVEILSGIIGDAAPDRPGAGDDKSTKSQKSKRESRSRSSRSPVADRKAFAKPAPVEDEQDEYNYVHYDPERHWCRTCDVFPSSAKDYLLHLHSSQHCETSKQHELADTPWHNATPEPELPSKQGAPVKRLPIKGLQFFNPATAWYCRLCDKWMGDLHCASLHLKSKTHVQNYKNFTDQNPCWESEWMSDREKAFKHANKNKDALDVTLNSSDASRTDSPEHKKKKKKRSKDKRARSDSSSDRDKKKRKKSKKKKKVESSDSSSDSTSSSDSSSEGDVADKSKSIRVMMRNKMKMQAQKILSEEFGDKLEALSQLMEEDKRMRKAKMDVSPIQQQKPVRIPEPPKKYEEKPEIVETSKFKPVKDEPRIDVLREYEQKEKALELAEAKLKEDEAKHREESERSVQYAVKKERSYRSRHYESPENEKRRGDKKYGDKYSPEKEKYDESPIRKKQLDRSPERKQYYDKKGSYSDKYQRSGRHKDDRGYGEKNSGSDRRSRERESSYDKKKSDSSQNDKKKSSSSSSTSYSKKLPFIGRMPLFKNKKQEADEKKEKEEQARMKSKFQQIDSSIMHNLPAPGLVHIYKLSSASVIKINAENPPPPPQIVPDPPMIIPEPPLISGYMEVAQMAVPYVPPVPIEIPRPVEQKPGNLPRDFQDALNIIFPKEGEPGKPEGETVAEPVDMQIDPEVPPTETVQYPGIEGYGYQQQIEYEQMMQEYSNAQYVMPPLPPTDEPEPPADEEQHEEPSSKNGKETLSQSEIDDLAMLGIDAEDMAAQNF